MNKVFHFIFLFSFVLACFTDHADAQRGPEAGVMVGTAFYFGDLNNLYRLNEPGFSGGVIARMNFDSRLCAKVNINYSRLRANDSKSNNAFDQRRNLSFYSNVYEITPAVEINFFKYQHGSKKFFYTPYLHLGFSVFHHDPRTKLNGEVFHLRSMGTEGQIVGQEYSTVTGAWNLGTGLKIDLNYRWSLNLDLSYRSVFTDYLDDVSKLYPNMSELLSSRGATAVALSDRSTPDINNIKMGAQGFQRGDSNDKDAFASITVGLVYFFGTLACPSISHPIE
ncbi:MAG TPA: DUF6089 family protein [Saprospiraceae bacterium]|nr:DUF6089 family protein [Saprospiraceae bacterium]